MKIQANAVYKGIKRLKGLTRPPKDRLKRMWANNRQIRYTPFVGTQSQFMLFTTIATQKILTKRLTH